MKRFVLWSAVATCLCLPAFADTATGHRLQLTQAVANFSMDVVKVWASKAAPFASMAVPVVPNAATMAVTDPRRNVQSAVSEGAASFAQSDKEALDICNQIRPKKLMPCVIVARVSQ